MSTITFDFRHYYQKGERRESDQIAYQWDLGHVAEIYVPVTAAYEVHYCFSDYTQTEDYAVESTSAAEDGGYKLTAHIPNKYFERSGELRVYVIGSDDNHILTTYEGYISIRGRIKPDDYTDDDPENGAETIIARARRYALESEAWADGQEEGVDVPSTAPQYHNNAKHYAEQSAAAIEAAADAAESAATATAKANEASSAASSASGSAAAAAESASAVAADKARIDGVYSTPDEFSTSVSYTLGDFCIYNNTIYCCKSAVTAGAEFNSNQWEATTLWDLLQDRTVNFGTISSLPQTFAVDGITPAHDMVRAEMGTPSAFTGDLTVNTDTSGLVTLSGTISGSSTLKIKFSPTKQETAQAVTS